MVQIKINFQQTEKALSALQLEYERLTETQKGLERNLKLFEHMQGDGIKEVKKEYTAMMMQLKKITQEVSNKIAQLKKSSAVYSETEKTCQNMVNGLPEGKRKNDERIPKHPNGILPFRPTTVVLKKRTKPSYGVRIPGCIRHEGRMHIHPYDWRHYVVPGPVIGHRLRHERLLLEALRRLR